MARAAVVRTRWELFDQNFGFWVADTAADLIPVHRQNYPRQNLNDADPNAIVGARLVQLIA
jgi:hypothetical protein